MGNCLIPPGPLISPEEMDALMQAPILNQSREPPIEIVFADPHPVVLDGLRKTFESDPGFVVKNCVNDGVSAWREIQKLQPDILVMELSLSEKDSLSLIRDLREENLKTLPVIFTHASMLDVVGVIAVGVNGLVSKSKSKEILAECIRAVHQGHKWWDEEFSVHDMSAVDAPLTRSTFERLLTLRELSIVQLVIRGLSNREIASTFSIAEGTVKIHLKHIYQKLRCDDRVELLSRIRRDI
jgi:two-component system, NarL family, nitrate/nitrite response regulator NarL